MKLLLILHRYLGVFVGLIMLMWCLSGFVMMYQGFPDTTRTETYQARSTLNIENCCDLGALPVDADARASFEIRVRANEPVIDIRGGDASGTYSLTNGTPVAALNETQIAGVMADFARANGLEAQSISPEPILKDQWSVYMWRRAAPLWRAELGDPADTYLYVSGQSGEVAQDANSFERILAWFGAIPHWLYPEILRANQPLWYQTVIWLTVVGMFLTVTGLTVGIIRLKRRPDRWSPYKKTMWLWHHLGGTIAGILVLTWAGSGLLTMQPWGLFESEPTTQRSQLTGSMNWAEAERLINDPSFAIPQDTISIRSAPFAGHPALVFTDRSGAQTRFAGSGNDILSPEYVSTALTSLALPVEAVTLLEQEDAYYYGHKEDRTFPVIRVQLADGDRTRAYIDPQSGQISRFVTATSKRYRWLESGFHSFDWPVLQERPFWDIVTLILMAAVTLVCGTGAWLSISRVRRDIKMAFRKKKKRRRKLA